MKIFFFTVTALNYSNKRNVNTNENTFFFIRNVLELKYPHLNLLLKTLLKNTSKCITHL